MYKAGYEFSNVPYIKLYQIIMKIHFKTYDLKEPYVFTYIECQECEDITHAFL